MFRFVQLVTISLLALVLAACEDEDTDFRKKVRTPVYQPCGGIYAGVCPEGFECVPDPNDDCDPDKGGADCSGICEVSSDAIPCGGFVARACPEGLMCIDDPRDSCYPGQGGADCIGICTTDNTM